MINVDSFPVNWYEEKKDKKDKREKDKDDTVYQSYVALHRKDDFVMPVEVEIKFDNGEKIREHWDGAEPLDSIQLPEKGEGRVGGTRSRSHRADRSQQLQQQLCRGGKLQTRK